MRPISSHMGSRNTDERCGTRADGRHAPDSVAGAGSVLPRGEPGATPWGGDMSDRARRGPSAPDGALAPPGRLGSFVEAQLQAIDAGEITESTLGLLTASAFFAGAARALGEPAAGKDVDSGLSALIARIAGLDAGNAAGLVTAVARLRARYRYMDDAHRAGAAAARQWRGEQAVTATGLRDLIRNSRHVSMADLGHYGIREAGRLADPGPPASDSERRPGAGLRRRIVFWLLAGVLAIAVNAGAYWLLQRL